MMGKTHMAVGTAAGATLALLHPEFAAVFIVASIGGSLVPDLDAVGSTGAHMFVKLALPAGLLFFLFLSPANADLQARLFDSCIVALFVSCLPLLTAILLPHRGPTHSILLWLTILLLAVLLIPYGLVWALVTGLVTGIIIGGIVPDAATPSGVPAFWPVYHERVHILPSGWRVRTGGLVELLLVRPLVCVAVALLLLKLLGHHLPLHLPTNGTFRWRF